MWQIVQLQMQFAVLMRSPGTSVALASVRAMHSWVARTQLIANRLLSSYAAQTKLQTPTAHMGAGDMKVGHPTLGEPFCNKANTQVVASVKIIPIHEICEKNGLLIVSYHFLCSHHP